MRKNFEESESDNIAFENITELSKWTEINANEVALNEYHRIVSEIPMEERKIIKKPGISAKETTPSCFKILLEEIFKGHCQLCNFFFIKKNKKPYFEIHHINPFRGHHPKNILSVCANCHRQFTYANVAHYFNDKGWLTRVRFNNREYTINHIDLSSMPSKIVKKTYI